MAFVNEKFHRYLKRAVDLIFLTWLLSIWAFLAKLFPKKKCSPKKESNWVGAKKNRP